MLGRQPQTKHGSRRQITLKLRSAVHTALVSSLLLTLPTFRLAAVPEPTSEQVMVGGVTRHFLLFVPAGLGTDPAPIVLVFHPKNTDAALIEHSLPFPAEAERRRFIAVFPDGLDHEWNGGRTAPDSAESKASDDVEFVASILDTLEARYRVDPKRVYATGISNGAIFCYTLAARLSARIAAVGPVAGNLGLAIPKRFPPRQPVSVIAFNGTDDTFVPFRGYPDPYIGSFSVPETIGFWVTVDQCDRKATVLHLPKGSSDEGTETTRLTFDNGASGTSVVSYIILHGGHTWPGQPHDAHDPKGRSTMAVNATKEILDFFALHPKQ
jgi:polyhydroxybutyrate depolymerase